MVIIPELQDLKDQILNDYATALNVDVSELGDTYIVRAKVLAGLIYAGYLTLSKVQQNVFYDIAEDDQLIRYGEQILGRSPAPATSGVYTLQVTGQIGAVIPASTQFVANDTTQAAGFIFILDNEYTLVSETDNVTVRALTPGTESQLFINDLLTAASPIASVDSEGVIVLVQTPPTAAEKIESYRADVLEATRLEAQGGAPSDYRLWASDVPEVRTVYPYAKLGSAGDVEIYIEATVENTAPGEIVGVPTQTTIDEVYKKQAGATPESGVLVINPTTNKGRKPITVFNILPLAVSPIPVDIYFEELTDTSISSQIRTVVDELLYNIRPYIAGASNITEKNDILTIGQIIAAVVNLIANTGISYTNLTMEVNGVVTNSEQFLAGDYPYLRTIYNNGAPI